MPHPLEQEPTLAIQARDFLADRRELTIGEGDGAIWLVYRPGMINAEYHKMVMELAKKEDSNHRVGVYSICTVVSDWDLTGPLVIEKPKLDKRGKPIRDDYGVAESETVELVPAGQKIPIKTEFVKYLNTGVLTYLTQAIGEDMKPDPKSETTS
jgi:hypothetical protein